MTHCLLMGRKTFDSIGRPLPGRQTIVLSRGGMPDAPTGISVVSDFAEVNTRVEPGRQVMVVGGGQIYEGALPAGFSGVPGDGTELAVTTIGTGRFPACNSSIFC